MFMLMIDYLNKGGGVMYVLLLACFSILYIGIGRYILYKRYIRTREFAFGKNHLNPSTRIQNDWFVQEYPELPDNVPTMNEEFVQEVLVYHLTRLEYGLDIMAAWISVAPLLGLLGTVIGMIQTFKMIMLFGVGDPSMMSEGISVALLTTEAGLMVAFPGLLFLNYLKNRKNDLTNLLLVDSEALIKNEKNY